MTRIAIARGTLVAGAAALDWQDPDTVDGTAPVAVVLDHAPKLFWAQRITAGASPGHLTLAVTAAGCTVNSSDVADDGQVRVYAVCRAADLGIGQGG